MCCVATNTLAQPLLPSSLPTAVKLYISKHYLFASYMIHECAGCVGI